MNTIKQPKWITFIELPQDKNKKKTKTFVIKNKEYGGRIGIVKWYSGWRKYTFFPDNNTLYESDCLSDISNFLTQLMKEHKLEAKTKDIDKNVKSVVSKLKKDSEVNEPVNPGDQSGNFVEITV